jgi:hypothetical protein
MDKVIRTSTGETISVLKDIPSRPEVVKTVTNRKGNVEKMVVVQDIFIDDGNRGL